MLKNLCNINNWRNYAPKIEKYIKTMKKILFSILIIATFIGCGKDDNNGKYSAEEAKAEVKATMDSFYNCLQKANDGGFANFL